MPVGATLSVATARLDGVVSVAIADTSPGVAPEGAERIFRPFHTTKALDAGLGLAVTVRCLKPGEGSIDFPRSLRGLRRLRSLHAVPRRRPPHRG